MADERETFLERLATRSRINKYILDAHDQPQPCEDLLEWAQWMEQAATTRQRMVAQDKDEGPDGQDITVSTVFLGLDHNYTLHGPPVLWETLVFGGPMDGEMDRYESREAALAGHQAMCLKVRAVLGR
jgi:hypothetical protein